MLQCPSACAWHYVRASLLAISLSLPALGWAEDPAGYAVLFGGDRTYQARGGEVQFTVIGSKEREKPAIVACLRWKTAAAMALAELGPEPGGKLACPPATHKLAVRQIPDGSQAQGMLYAATIPPDFPEPEAQTERRAVWIPVAQLEVIADDPVPTASPLRICDIGITSRRLASITALLATLIAGGFLYRFAVYLGVPAPEVRRLNGIPHRVLSLARGCSVPLRIVSTSEGWASLSQFQIILWSFVVGAGAVYVMMLTRSLIPISGGVLALLGIAGTATVLSELKESSRGESPSSLAPPGPVQRLDHEEPHAGEVCVFWWPPETGAAATGYVVQYRVARTEETWRTATRKPREMSLVRSRRFRLVGLDGGRDYEIQIVATNEAGSGPASPSLVVSIPAVPRMASATFPSDLRAQAGSTGTSIQIEWDAKRNERFSLAYRAHDGDAQWVEVAERQFRADRGHIELTRLKPNSAYDFQLRSRKSPTDSSRIETFYTGARVPHWSDLVTETNRPAEIDVTRVQMLFFTVISAVFVTMNIIDSGAIPTIDPTYVMLMGISNGVYVTSKFVRNY